MQISPELSVIYPGGQIFTQIYEENFFEAVQLEHAPLIGEPLMQVKH